MGCKERKKKLDDELKKLSNEEIKLFTNIIAELVDSSLKPGDDGDDVYDFIVAAFNRILKKAQTEGLDARYEAVELATRCWLMWQAYQKEYNPGLLKEMFKCVCQLMIVAGEEPPKEMEEYLTGSK